MLRCTGCGSTETIEEIRGEIPACHRLLSRARNGRALPAVRRQDRTVVELLRDVWLSHCQRCIREPVKLRSQTMTPEETIAAKDAEIARLRTALASVPKLAEEIHARWDDGMKAGKMLIALMDADLKYRPDITAIHNAIRYSISEPVD